MESLINVLNLVAAVPRGKITTYGRIGRALGMHPRQVGRILHHNPDPDRFPCHRVVRSDGSLASGYAFGGCEAQMERLQGEGIVFVNGRVESFRRLVHSFESN